MEPNTAPDHDGMFDRLPDRTATAGTLRIELWHVGREPEPRPDRGARQRYAYRITDTDTDTRPSGGNGNGNGNGNGGPASEAVAVGDDLRSGVGARVDPDDMLRSLVSFLSAAGEAYAYTMRNPATPSDNMELFPAWLAEASYLNISELALLEIDLNPDPERDDDGAFEAAFMAATERQAAPAPWPPATWYNVVFLQGDEGHEIVDVIETDGVEAGFERLFPHDFGDETRDAALFHGHYYDQPPTTIGSYSVEHGAYHLNWHPGLGDVSLLCRFDPADTPPVFWADRAAPLPPTVPKTLPAEPPPAHPTAGPPSPTPGL